MKVDDLETLRVQRILPLIDLSDLIQTLALDKNFEGIHAVAVSLEESLRAVARVIDEACDSRKGRAGTSN